MSAGVRSAPAGTAPMQRSAIGSAPLEAPLEAPSVASITAICERASRGDLEARVVGLDQASELATLGHAINRMLDIADSFVREASAAMDSCASGRFHRPILEQGLQGAYRQAAAVINVAGVSMRESHDQIAFAGRLAVDNSAAVTVVAAACQELSASGAEISRQAGQVATMTQEAVDQATTAVEAATALHEVGRTIAGIVSVIHRVAEQTNLLALNAMIEAARAGEQGKGFAVVATEVKELSRSTAKASNEITSELERMVKSVTAVGQIVESVRDTITRTHGNVDAIETSMREQALATTEISQGIAEVSKNTTLVSERIGDRVDERVPRR